MHGLTDDQRSRDAAVEALYLAHGDQLLRLAVLLTGDRQLAEELVQEAFARLWHRRDRLRDPGAGAGYLRVTLVNLARSSLRRRLRELRQPQGPPAVTDPPDVADRLDVLRALKRLPMRKRACVVLRYFADLSEEETARLLGVSVGTVKSQTHKGLTQLAGLLAGRGPVPPVPSAPDPPAGGRRP